MGKDILRLKKGLLTLLHNHPFPGNVRELKTYIYDAVAQCHTQELTEDAVKERLFCERENLAEPSPSQDRFTLSSFFGHFPTLAELTEYAVNSALESADYNQSRAAGMLGISKQALNKRLQKRKKTAQ